MRAACAGRARAVRASCAGHSSNAPATRCALVDFFNTCALYALCMRIAYVQRASNTLCMRCQLASFLQILTKVRRTTTHWPYFSFFYARTVRRAGVTGPLACKTLVHALVTSTLDFGNAALFGITGTLLHRLEMVQRAAVRVVLCIDRRDHRSMTEALRQPHWLPMAQRIQFKVLTLMHGAVHNSTQQYLSDRISTYTPPCGMRCH